jgi:hypothetical protein
MPRRQPTPPHGDHRRYANHGCRCTPCRHANTVRKDRHRRLVAYGRWRGESDPTGTVRRAQAIARAGWPARDVAAETGLSLHTIRVITRGEPGAVRAGTYDAFAAAYNKLAEREGPSATTRSRAAAKGWHDHWAWTEDTIDDPNAGPNLGDVEDEAVDDVLVRRALAQRAAFDTLNRAEQVALWVAYQRRAREEWAPTRPPRKEFANTYGITVAQVDALTNAAAGLNTKGNPIRKPAQQAVAA